MSCVLTKIKGVIGITLVFLLLTSFEYQENKTVYNSSSKLSKKIALTFDDGPHPKITPKILDILDKYNIRATFFVIGVNVDNYPQPLKRAVKEGHEIGNHTNSHVKLIGISDEAIENEINECKRKVFALTGYCTTILRPPCGLYNEKLVNFAKNTNEKIILWNIDTHDWKHMSVENIVNNVNNKISGGNIILFHDYISGENHTVDALEVLIPNLLSQGYEFVTVSELLQ